MTGLKLLGSLGQVSFDESPLTHDELVQSPDRCVCKVRSWCDVVYKRCLQALDGKTFTVWEFIIFVIVPSLLLICQNWNISISTPWTDYPYLVHIFTFFKHSTFAFTKFICDYCDACNLYTVLMYSISHSLSLSLLGPFMIVYTTFILINTCTNWSLITYNGLKLQTLSCGRVVNGYNKHMQMTMITWLHPLFVVFDCLKSTWS